MTTCQLGLVILKTKTNATLDSWSDSIAVTTTLSGETVTVAAGRDLTSQGAQIAGTGDVLLAAGRDVILGVAENTHTEVHDKTVTKSGLFSGGGVGFTIGKQQTDTTADIAEKTHTGSLIGSTDGRVDIAAGRDVTITGSDVLSREGIGIIGQNVTIQAAEDSTSVTETQKFKQAGINVSLKGGAVDTAMAVKNSVERASEAKDGRLSALHAAKAGQTLFSSGGAGMSSLKGMGDQIGQAKADVANEEQTAGGLSLRIGIGASKSSSSTEYTASTSSGSRIASEGDVVIQATGDGQGNGGDLKIIGSKIESDNVALAAANDLILKSQQETRQQIERSKSSSGEIGITIGSEAGFGVYVAASAAKGKGDGSGTTHAETTIDATNTLTMISGRDMTLEGAQARGKTVIADVGRDLTLISQQDSNDYKRKDVSGGIDVAVGTGGASVSANFNQSKIDSTYTSVKEQTGIQAGEGGFDIYVGGHTQLTGAAIASTADPSRNHLSTGSLSVEDLKNEAAYKASSIGISVSGSSSGGMNAPAPSVSIPQSEKASSVTRGDIAAGTVEVRNGDSNALEGLDRTATVLQQDGLKEIFDQLKVQERLEIGQVAAEVGMRTAGDIAQKMGWEEGSKEKVLLHGAVGAAIAALGGGSALDGLSGVAASQLASGAVLNYLGSNNINPDSAEGTALMELASIAIGAAVGEGSGAVTALAGEQFNRQLHPRQKAAVQELAEEGYSQTQLEAMACYEMQCWVGTDLGVMAAELERQTYEVIGAMSAEEREEIRSAMEHKAPGLFKYDSGDYLSDVWNKYDMGGKVKWVGETTLDFTPGIGDAKAFYEADSPSDYGWATIGVIPFGGDFVSKIGKGTRISGVASGIGIPQVIINHRNGVAFEQDFVDALGHVGAVKNTVPVTVQLSSGKVVKTIPDLAGRNVGGVVEIKNVVNISMSDQLRAQIRHAGVTGQPFNLVVSQRTSRISAEVLRQVRATGGEIYRYNPGTGEFSKY